MQQNTAVLLLLLPPSLLVLGRRTFADATSCSVTLTPSTEPTGTPYGSVHQRRRLSPCPQPTSRTRSGGRSRDDGDSDEASSSCVCCEEGGEEEEEEEGGRLVRGKKTSMASALAASAYESAPPPFQYPRLIHLDWDSASSDGLLSSVGSIGVYEVSKTRPFAKRNATLAKYAREDDDKAWTRDRPCRR